MTMLNLNPGAVGAVRMAIAVLESPCSSEGKAEARQIIRETAEALEAALHGLSYKGRFINTFSSEKEMKS